MSTSYAISLPAFDGPLDLLLHLIDREELDVTAISLTQVTAQYLAQVEALKESRIDNLIDFLVIGARLMLIKSRALLPQEVVIPIEGEEEEEDPAEALLRQLRLYKQFKTIAGWLGERERAGLRTYLRVAPPPKVVTKLDLAGVTLYTLTNSYLTAVERNRKREASVALVKPRRITIEDQIRKLRSRIKRQKRIQFNQLLSDSVDRVELSITLLAVLESIKRQEVNAVQTELFGPVEIVAATTEES